MARFNPSDTGHTGEHLVIALWRYECRQRPGLTTLTIITLIGLVFFVQGLVYLINAFTTRVATGGQRMLSVLFAILSFVAGVWLWRYPFHGSLAFVWLLGLYAIVSGALMIAIGSNDDVV
jgi:uncharacterized membrane protein HdeD (DUF308 family)